MQQGQQPSSSTPGSHASSLRPGFTTENAQWPPGSTGPGMAYQVGPQVVHPQAFAHYQAAGYVQPQHSQEYTPYMMAYPQQAGWYQMPVPAYQHTFPQQPIFYMVGPQQHPQPHLQQHLQQHPQQHLQQLQQPMHSAAAVPTVGLRPPSQPVQQMRQQQVGRQQVGQQQMGLHQLGQQHRGQPIRGPSSQPNGWLHPQQPEMRPRQGQHKMSRTLSQHSAADGITQALEATNLNGNSPAARAAAVHDGHRGSAAVQSASEGRSSTSSEARPAAPQVFALDVECVATGMGCRDRAVAQIAVLDDREQVVLNLYVRPEEPVTSYLTDLTGLTREILDAKGVSFASAMKTFHSVLPPNAILMSYNIDTDLKWLDLEYKIDREEVRDLKGCYQQDPKTGRYTRRVWGQDHLARCLLGEVADRHDAVGDALKSMRLWQLYNTLRTDPEEHAKALDLTDSTPKKPSFAVRHPTYEDVCMGNRKTCQCGQNAPGGLQRQPQSEASIPSGAQTAQPKLPANGKRPPGLLIP